MSAPDRPTEADKVDAVQRVMDEFDLAHQALNRAAAILRERQPHGAFSGYPLFPFTGEKVKGGIEQARKALWASREVLAVQFLDSTRIVQGQSPDV